MLKARPFQVGPLALGSTILSAPRSASHDLLDRARWLCSFHVGSFLVGVSAVRDRHAPPRYFGGDKVHSVFRFFVKHRAATDGSVKSAAVISVLQAPRSARHKRIM